MIMGIKGFFEDLAGSFRSLCKMIGYDGLLHVLCTAVIILIMHAWVPIWAAVLVGAAAGLFKEFIWDKLLKKGTYDPMDFMWDYWGLLLGIVLCVAF